jgi:hypothetical protein
VAKAIKANKIKKAKKIVKKKRAKKVQAELVAASAPLAAASADPKGWEDMDKTWIPDAVDIDGKKYDNNTPITFWQAVREMFGFK